MENPSLLQAYSTLWLTPPIAGVWCAKGPHPGMKIDIGHLRKVSWARDSDMKKWVA